MPSIPKLLKSFIKNIFEKVCGVVAVVAESFVRFVFLFVIFFRSVSQVCHCYCTESPNLNFDLKLLQAKCTEWKLSKKQK